MTIAISFLLILHMRQVGIVFGWVLFLFYHGFLLRLDTLNRRIIFGRRACSFSRCHLARPQDSDSVGMEAEVEDGEAEEKEWSAIDECRELFSM